MKYLFSLSTLLTLILLLSSCDAPLGDNNSKPRRRMASSNRITPQLSSDSDTLATIMWKGKQTKMVEGELLLKLSESSTHRVTMDSLEILGAKILNHPNKLNWIQIKIPGIQKMDTTVIEKYQKLPGVLHAQPNFVNTIDAFIPNDLDNRQWALNNTGQSPANGTADADVDAPDAWDITTGSSNVIIAILDSGIPMQNGQLSHPDLDDPNKIILGPDYAGDGEGVRDRFGHGTHVAGIAGAETDNNVGIAGTCPDCKLMIIQVANAYGQITDSHFQSAVIYAVDHNADIINFSAGGPVSQTKEDAVIYAQNHNVLLVASAGNDDGGSVKYPAAYAINYNNVIAVSATDHNDVIANYSNVGPEITLAAPGGYGGSTFDADDIWSTTPNYSVNLGTKMDYDYLAGTSMAAPYVSGAAALKLASDPSLTPGDIKIGLENTADKVSGMNGAYRTDEYGRGRLNIFEAVRPLSVYISGPSQVNVGQSNTWTANASGGTPSYTYFWYWRSELTYPDWNYYTTTQIPDLNFTFESWMVPSGGSTAWLKVVVQDLGSGSTEGVYTVRVY